MPVEEIGFDDNGAVTGRTPKYEGRKDVTDRISVVFPKQNRAAKTHYSEAARKHIICSGGLCCEKLGPPVKRLGNVVIQYATDNTGKLKEPFQYELKTWTFSEKKFAQLATLHQEHPLDEHDLLVTCKDEKYKNYSFLPCREALWRKNAKLTEKVLKEAEVLRNQIYLGSEVTTEKLRELLGQTPEAESGSDETDYSNLLNGLDS